MISTFTIHIIILFIIALVLLINLIYKNKNTFFNMCVYDNDETTNNTTETNITETTNNTTETTNNTTDNNITETFISTSIYDVNTIKSTVDSLYDINMSNIHILSNNIDTLLNGNVPSNLTMIGNFNIIPSGYIMAYTGTSDIIQYTDFNNQPLVGWFICDGRSIDKLTYNNLFLVIGNLFTNSSSDNVNNFNLPDYRGAFLRGNGTAFFNSNNVSTSLNTLQNDSIIEHTHNVNDIPHLHDLRTNYDKFNVEKDKTPYYLHVYRGEDSANYQMMTDPTLGQTDVHNTQHNTGGINKADTEKYVCSTNYANITLEGVISYKNKTINVGFNETRPTNYAVNWIIKT